MHSFDNVSTEKSGTLVNAGMEIKSSHGFVEPIQIITKLVFFNLNAKDITKQVLELGKLFVVVDERMPLKPRRELGVSVGSES